MARLNADEKYTGCCPRTGMVVNTGVANVYREAAFQSVWLQLKMFFLNNFWKG